LLTYVRKLLKTPTSFGTATVLGSLECSERIVELPPFLLEGEILEVGLVDKLGRTPLHRSAGLGYGAATKLLVDRGSVVTTKDNDARTARDLAEGSDRAIKALKGEEPDFYMYKDRMVLL